MPPKGAHPTTALPPTNLESSVAEQPISLMHVSKVVCVQTQKCYDECLCYLFQILMVLMAQMGQ